VETTVDAPGKPFRIRAVAIAVAAILALAFGGWSLATWVAEASENPYADVPQLGLPVSDYVMLPSLGWVHQVGDVDVVLMSTVALEDGGTALHFVLHGRTGLPRYGVRLMPESGESTDTCEASGRSGWGECYLRVPQSSGDSVTLNLIVDREPVGSFDLTIPNPDGSRA
jgi:hypothetical protein